MYYLLLYLCGQNLKQYYYFALSYAQPKDVLILELGLLSIGKKNIFWDKKNSYQSFISHLYTDKKILF